MKGTMRSAYGGPRALSVLFILSMAVTISLSTGCLTKVRTGLEYTDDTGETIELDHEPQRIITLSPAITEMVFLLGRGDRICGRDSACNYPDEAMDILVVSAGAPNLEMMAALEPDIVLMDRTLDASGETYGSIKGLGIPVYRVSPSSVNDVLENIEDIGRILGASDEAERIVSDLRGRMDAVAANASRIDDASRPVVLHVVYYDGTADPWAATDSTFSGDMIDIAGGTNTIKGTGALYVQVPIERLIAADPDIIITSQSETWPTVSRATILSDPSWGGIEAVKNGQVHDLEGDWMDRPGPRCLDGLEAVFALIMNVTGGG